MKNNAPKLSILLPTYNPGKSIKRGIQSVLAQSFDDFELFVIDDGSSEDVFKKFLTDFKGDERVVYLRSEHNLGIQKTLNEGLRGARGAYIARIDDDDEWIDSDKLKKQVRFLDSSPEHVLVGCGAVFVDEEGSFISEFKPPGKDEEIRKIILSRNCFIHSSVLFRKDAALRFGGYDESVDTRHVEDYDLWLKLGKVGKLANMPFAGVKFTVRKSSISSKNLLAQTKKNIALAKKYKKYYPRFFSALTRGYGRLFFYGAISFPSSGLAVQVALIKRKFYNDGANSKKNFRSRMRG